MKMFDFVFGPRIRIILNHGKLAVHFKGKSIYSPTLPSSIPQNQWKHFAVTITDDGEDIEVQFYVDGSLFEESERSNNGVYADGSGPVSFQCYNCQFTGLNLIKDKLTASQILDVSKDYKALESIKSERIVRWEEFKQIMNDEEVSIHEYPF